MANENITPCTYAIERHRDFAKWRNLWTILLYIFGCTVVLFLVVSILLFIRQDWLPGAISAIGTIVNGAGITWVCQRRTEAKEEEEKAYEDVTKKCTKEIDPKKVSQLLTNNASKMLLFRNI